MINEANQVHDDINQKFEKIDFTPVRILEALHLIFQKNMENYNELSNPNDLKNHLDQFFKNLSGKYPSKSKPYPIDYSIIGDSGPFLYKLCKILKPQLIVETGVAYGVSSSYILKALHENNKGKLISIDSIFRPWQSKEMIGAAIPTNLRSRWELMIGVSENILETVLKTSSSVDIFLHDSLHTYKNMLFEFQTSWPFLKEGGFLLSDDVTSNNAFSDFYTSVNRMPIILIQEKTPPSYLGILKK